MANENTVTLTLSSYNQIKAENYRLNLLLDNMLMEATSDGQNVIFNPNLVEQAVKFCFPDRWRKKLSQQKEEKNNG